MCVLLLLPACGYSTKSSLPASIRAIAVLSFENKIDFQAGKANVYLPLLEVKAHDAVVKQFLFNGSLRVVKEEDADLVLKGELISYERSVLRYTDSDDVQEYRVQIAMNLTMTDPEGKVLWQENGFAGEGSYFLSGPAAGSEATAVQDAVNDLAKRVVERTVEDW